MNTQRFHLLAFTIFILLLNPVLAMGTLQPYEKDTIDVSFELEDTNGKPHHLSDYHGNVILVNFWASWCSPCLQEIPSMQRLSQSMKENSFEIIAINVSEQKQRVLRRLKRMDMTFTVLFDPKGETFNQWQAKILPTSFLLDKKGHIRYQAAGPIEWDSDSVSQVIKQLLLEE